MQGMGSYRSDQEYTYGTSQRDRKELLFHNPIDPYQMNNLAEDRSKASLLAHYRSMSDSWRKEMNDSFEPCTAYQSWAVDRNIVDTAKGVKQNIQELKKILRWFPNATGDRPVSDIRSETKDFDLGRGPSKASIISQCDYAC